MFNSCPFNASKFNTTCLIEISIPEVEGGGGIRLRTRKHKILRREYFKIVGTKLIYCEQLFNLIGFVLLAQELNISLTAKTLSQIQKDFVLNGTKLISFNIQTELRGLKKYLEEQELDVASFRLILAKQIEELQGTRLLKGTKNVSINGQKQILNSQENIIKGTKDIRNILAVLDLLDMED